MVCVEACGEACEVCVLRCVCVRVEVCVEACAACVEERGGAVAMRLYKACLSLLYIKACLTHAFL